MKRLSLKEIQQTELSIMTEFDRAAREHGLRYSMCAGTLLGAVRHKGFIPWDDDIDVMMPRPDYEKLIRLNRKGALFPEHLELKCFEDRTLDAPFMKIFDKRTKASEHNYRQKDVTSLWIDVFPVDGLPEGEQRIRRHYQKAHMLCRINVAAVVRMGYGSGKLVIFLKDFLMKPISKLLGRKRTAASLRRLALKYPFEKSKECGMVTWAYDGPGQAVPSEAYDRLIELDFEGHSFLALPVWHENLTGIFGDYMQLPPEAERLSHELEAFADE